jgi:hypothetical protein
MTTTPTATALPTLPLGQVVVTAAVQTMLDAGELTRDTIGRILDGMAFQNRWSDAPMDPEDRRANDAVAAELRAGTPSDGRLFCTFKADNDTPIWAISEGWQAAAEGHKGYPVTTILLPSDY